MIRVLPRRKDGDLIPNRRINVRDDIYIGGYHHEDKKALVQYLNDLIIYHNTLNIPYPYTATDADNWITHIAREKRRLGIQPNWTIRHTEHGMIGGIGMVVTGDTVASYQEIGYWIAKPFRQQGIMTDAIRVFTEHCFKRYKEIEAMTAHIFLHNDASQATIKKAGFTMTKLIDDYYKKGDANISAYEFVLHRPMNSQSIFNTL